MNDNREIEDPIKIDTSDPEVQKAYQIAEERSRTFNWSDISSGKPLITSKDGAIFDILLAVLKGTSVSERVAKKIAVQVVRKGCEKV